MSKLCLPIGGIDKHKLRRVCGHLIFMDLGEGRNDDQIPNRSATCSRTVHGNHACSTFTANGISDEPFTVVDVPDVDLLVLRNVGRIKQVFVKVVSR